MSWIVFPAIDIRNGKSVRLYQGDYQKETIYGDPIEIAEKWQRQGAKWLHLVDLDGAKEGKPTQVEVVEKIVDHVKIPVQIGGGIREIKSIEKYYSIGVKRVILGTSALTNQQLLIEALKMNQQGIAVSIDARNGYVATNGWLNTSSMKASDLGEKLAALGVKTFVYTDISRDGTLTGPNVEATKDFALKTKANVVASGGISSVEDLKKLKRLEKEGIIGAIVGKAIYSGDVSFKEIANLVN